MPVVAVPANVGSITLSTSGVLVPASRFITVTAAEATAMVQSFANGANGKGIVRTNPANGNYDLKLPSVITSITINGNVYAPDANGVIFNVPAADGLVFMTILQHRFSCFVYVSA